MGFHMEKGKKKPAGTVEKLSEYYTINSDGSFTLDLAKAIKSDTFKSRIRHITQHELKLAK